MKKKLKIFLVFFILSILIMACAAQKVSRAELIADLNSLINDKKCDVSRLEYQGTKNGYHHIYSICAMYVTKRYLIPASELKIDPVIPLTDESSKSIAIQNIGKEWVSSSRSWGKWEKEIAPYGIAIP